MSRSRPPSESGRISWASPASVEQESTKQGSARASSLPLFKRLQGPSKVCEGGRSADLLKSLAVITANERPTLAQRSDAGQERAAAPPGREEQARGVAVSRRLSA
jgi:hypothetical protein